MTIGGFQSLSLLDCPGRPCAIVFMQGCVFRCAYCHNPDLIPLDIPARHSEDEIIARITKNKFLADAVCITGGEPTLQQGLLPFMRRLKEDDFFVKLDTNGIRPGVVRQAIDERLVDYIAMDIKAPWEKYEAVIGSGRGAFVDACKATCAFIQASGVDHEFRTTIHPSVHTPDDIMQIARYLASSEKFFVQKTSFRRTLEPLKQTQHFDVPALIKKLQTACPSLIIAYR